MALLMRTCHIVCATTPTSQGYGPFTGQVGQRIEWERFIALERIIAMNDATIPARLQLRIDNESDNT